jgi:hypothetical protein
MNKNKKLEDLLSENSPAASPHYRQSLLVYKITCRKALDIRRVLILTLLRRVFIWSLHSLLIGLILSCDYFIALRSSMN